MYIERRLLARVQNLGKLLAQVCGWVGWLVGWLVGSEQASKQ